ncbi:MAG: deoxyribonuclease V [Anaerolineae bacterium]
MLLPVSPPNWDVTPGEAVTLQATLRQRINLTSTLGPVRLVAGVDVGLRGNTARAAVAVLSFPELELVEHVTAEGEVAFPYVPGLLSFREGPVILDALARMASTPDVLMFDGQGYAHPRRMGIATHVGILLDHPTIGCAKSRLWGKYEEPGPERGAYTWLLADGETIGAVVRTRDHVRPLFVSAGHRVDHATAIDLVLRCGTRYRLPEPTRWAHRLASDSTRMST